MFYKLICLIQFFVLSFYLNCFASVKQCEFTDQFYPAHKYQLSSMIDNYLEKAYPPEVSGDIFMLLAPHAGYGYSGQTAAFGYKLIKNKHYKTIIILGASHHQAFNGAAVYAKGSFSTPLGQLNIDEEFTQSILEKNNEFFADESVFNREHSVEVQLPFLQKVLKGFKIVPIVAGDCSLDTCNKIAQILKMAIGERNDVLVVVSSDLYHGYDFAEADTVDALTLGLIKQMDYQGLYYALRETKAQACGGIGIVIGLALAKELGYNNVKVLNQTNSAIVTENRTKGEWTVGYASCAVFKKREANMLSNQQKRKLLILARQTIDHYLKTGKKLDNVETDSVLNQKMGAFVTLTQDGQLRGCIGNLIGTQPVYLTVRDMAIEAAVDDPRFRPLKYAELNDLQIEISVLSPLKQVDSADQIELGKHGVLVRRGMQSGVFLPQVATETGWSKDEFLNTLCSQKAGLPSDAWKNKDTQLYIFNAQVFSEKDLGE
ncbi:MAG: AmmeMemoRadiSam system protein B [Candidatus Omnitrophota bacterium]